MVSVTAYTPSRGLQIPHLWPFRSRGLLIRRALRAVLSRLGGFVVFRFRLKALLILFDLVHIVPSCEAIHAPAYLHERTITVLHRTAQDTAHGTSKRLAPLPVWVLTFIDRIDNILKMRRFTGVLEDDLGGIGQGQVGNERAR